MLGLITLLKYDNRWYPCFMLKMQNENYRITTTHSYGYEKRNDAVKCANGELTLRIEQIYHCEFITCLRDVKWNGEDEFCKITQDIMGAVCIRWELNSEVK